MNSRSGILTSCSVVLPVFNEAGNLDACVRDALSVLPTVSDDYEIILVDDGSSDGTPDVIATLVSRHPAHIRTIRHDANRGYGAALRSGFMAADKEFVFFTDSDGQFSFGDLPQFAAIMEDFDIVIGYRVRRNDPWFRKLNSRIGNLLARATLGVRVRDINCAYKLIRTGRLHQLPLESDGALINTELLAHAAGQKWRCLELPVPHHPRKSGQPTGAAPLVILKTFQEYFLLRKRIRRVIASQPSAQTVMADS